MTDGVDDEVDEARDVFAGVSEEGMGLSRAGLSVGKDGGVDFAVEEESNCLLETALVDELVVLILLENSVEAICNDGFRSLLFDEIRVERL